MVQCKQNFLPSIQLCVTRDHLKALPQSIVNSLINLVYSMAIIYAVAAYGISFIGTSCSPTMQFE